MKKIICIILTLFFTTTLLTANDSEVTKEVATKLDKIGAIMAKATLDQDYETMLKYNSDDVVVMPNFQPTINGKKELKKIYKKNTDAGIDYHAFSSEPQKRWQADNLIYEYGTFGMTVSSSSSKKPKGYYGSYFQIWEKSGDDFKIKLTIWNLDHSPI